MQRVLILSFDFCEPGEDVAGAKPTEGAKVSENLGQILLGERIRTSPYKVLLKLLLNFIQKIAMHQDVSCASLCKPKKYSLDDKDSMIKFKKLERVIKLDYMHHW